MYAFTWPVAVAVLFLGSVALVKGKEGWVWDDNSRSAKAKARYEIFEPEEHHVPPFQNQFNGPPPIDGAFGPPLGPHHQQYPVRPPIKKFDTCTCTEKFNCRSPGLSYGHCDTGKSYCCFNKHGGVELEPAPSRPIQNPANGILVGPSAHSEGFGHSAGSHHGGPPLGHHGPPLGQGAGGAVEHFGVAGPYERPYERPFLGPGPLVGPVPDHYSSRPGARPVYSAANGVLVGPDYRPRKL